MSLVIPANHGMIRYVFTGGPSDPIVTTLGFEAGIAVVSPADAAQAAANAWTPGTSLRNGTSLTYTLDRVEVEMNTGGPFPATAILPVGFQGGSLADAAPPQVAYLIRKQTAVGGRPNRGRMYHPGVPEAGVLSSGFLTGNWASDFQARCDTFYGLLVGAGVLPRVLHTSPAIAPTTITALKVDQRVATQRRRLR